jgi:hypothetical protein
MNRAKRVAANVVVGLAVLIGGIGALPGVASAGEYKFHAHMNFYAKPACSGFTWSNAAGLCEGRGEYVNDSSGQSFPFQGANIPITVSWAPANQPEKCGHKPMPAGYDRWMKVSTSDGYWLCGAVKSWESPNGVFAVVGGVINGGAVIPTSSTGASETRGGPLFLWVGYHGQDPWGHGYVFGLRGYLNY